MIEPLARAVEIRKKSSHSGLELPVYGLGTWGLGGTFTTDHSRDEAALESIRRALALGVTHIDTAEMYGDGHAEELIGQAIQGYPRERLIIGSKALGHHLRERDLVAAAERSIARLRCDYLDIYMIHHPNDEIPIAETMRGMDELVRRGLVRHVGVSNFSKARLEKAQQHSPQPIALNQVHYSLCVREPERSGLLEYCQQQGILLVAWQPIDRAACCRESSPALKPLCEKYQRTPVQIALSWVTSQPGVAAISRTSSAEHLHENLQGAATTLAAEDIEFLRRNFQPQQEHSDVYCLH